MLSDLQHLQRYASTGDAHAFRELVRAHGGMVHATALRVTKNEATTQDVAQEVFLELARKAGSITQSVAAWLHRVAWNRACDAVRRERSRRRAEDAMAETWHTHREATWADLEPHVDEALNELPGELHEVLVLYFLEDRTQAEIARHLGRNQATVSRCIERGITAMRQILKSRGITCGAGLAAIFAAQPAQAMPFALQTSLGKLSMAGIGSGSAAVPAATFVSSSLIAMTTTTKALLITGTLTAASLAFVLPRPQAALPSSKPPSARQSAARTPVAKNKASGVSDQEMFAMLFGPGTDRLSNARSLVDEYRVAHPGKSLIELAKDPALAPKLQALMQDMMTQPEVGRQFGEATELAMKIKGIKPSPGTNVTLNMGDGFLDNESQAERYLGAVLSRDAQALAQFLTDVLNEASMEMALDPGAEKTSGGVSISTGPLPPGTKVIQPDPED
ncbi:RNA polymerase sigma factor [Prosthecobacter vanneervenii]|uniref:RNA polymerase sigma factor (Sigma-70 family) n=1 Tax=Prosthecobacter vanneervenii TaxID=48466 RepID=A0A7W7Y8L5_9BACT|nr:sigma-70 family RNA polymerase sigma factor [Prosthecobacter vanneervenii]MBB5031616.1 RNA polymerase sigma factor (sigma-70 family) [Prosthecobacter vanneervenii]